MSLPAPTPFPSPSIGAGRCRARPRPARATRIGTPPRPRARPLGEVLAELVRPTAAPAATGPAAAPLPTRGVSSAAPSAPSAPAVASDDPSTRTVVLRLLQAVVEVLDGDRPAAHLLRSCDDGVRVSAVLVHVAGPGRRRARSRLRGVRLCAVAPGTVEAAGVVHRDDRARALAARLDHDGGSWRFTALTVL